MPDFILELNETGLGRFYLLLIGIGTLFVYYLIPKIISLICDFNRTYYTVFYFPLFIITVIVTSIVSFITDNWQIFKISITISVVLFGFGGFLDMCLYQILYDSCGDRMQNKD